MPQITYRANLSSAIFPLSLAQAGRSVIIPGPDNTYDRRVDPEGEQKNAGIPQAIYLENVIPTANGYQSIGYKYLDTVPFGSTSRTVYRVEVIGDYAFAFVIGSGGYDKCFYADASTGVGWTAHPTWMSILGAPYIGTGQYQTVSYGTVRGTTYIFANSVLATLTGTTLSDVSGSVTGITLSDVQSILVSYNYLIAIMNDGSVAWSSTTTPTDFTVSLVSGAGSATPNAIRSQIIAAYACPEGFIIYTEDGAVLARYTGNSRYPWKFTEISNSGGHSFEFNISAPETSSAHFTFNSHGTITQISSEGAVQLAPEVSSLLRASACPLDSYNRSTNTLTTAINLMSAYRIYYVLNRYLLLYMARAGQEGIALDSMGVNYCIVYDILLRRYGRFYGDPRHFWASSSKLFSCSVTGIVEQIVFDIHDGDAEFNSVLALGKFQYVRSRRLELHEIVIEGERPADEVVILPTTDGKTFLPVVIPVVATSEESVKIFNCRAEGHNHTIVLLDRFSVDTLELTMSPGAGR